MLFPLCRALGLVHGATPALVERVAHYQAESGATQKQTLARLRREHGVCWGVKRLRQVAEFVAAAMEEHRPQAQAEQVLGWLEQAQASRGRHRPVLSVGRDGITLGLRIKGCTIYEVATTGTLSVYDRRGRRLGTVYLAYTPEPGQPTMSEQLTRLAAGGVAALGRAVAAAVLRHRRGGQRDDLLPEGAAAAAASAHGRAAGVVLGGGLLPCVRAVVDDGGSVVRGGAAVVGVGAEDAEAAAETGRRGPGAALGGGVAGPGAAAGKRLADFRRAYRYLQARRQHLRYAEYRRLGVPMGSGVTEAACKTVYTQRLKLSGMRWQKAGAQTILTLRVLLLSGVWEQVYERTLAADSEVQVRTPDQLTRPAREKSRVIAAWERSHPRRLT